MNNKIKIIKQKFYTKNFMIFTIFFAVIYSVGVIAGINLVDYLIDYRFDIIKTDGYEHFINLSLYFMIIGGCLSILIWKSDSIK